MKEELLIERIIANWKIILSFSGEKVVGKRGRPIKNFTRVKKALEPLLSATILFSDDFKRILAIDRNNPYIINVAFVLYDVEADSGTIRINTKLEEIVNNFDSWKKNQEYFYNKMMESFRNFCKFLVKIHPDFLIRADNFYWFSSKIEEINYKLSVKKKYIL